MDTLNSCQNEAFDSKAVSAAGPCTLFVHTQETSYKLTVHGRSLTDYPDNGVGMEGLKRELELGNTDLHITTSPQNITHTSKREGKLHSSIVISLTDKDMCTKLSKLGVKIFGVTHISRTFIPPRRKQIFSRISCAPWFWRFPAALVKTWRDISSTARAQSSGI